MSQENKFSDEFINAFVDDQLSPDEKAQAYARVAGDEALMRQICELRKLHDLVGLAYKEPPMPPQGLTTFGVSRRVSLGLAAGLALAIGGVAGWFLHAPTAPTGVSVAQAPGAEEPAKVLIHVSDGSPEHLKNALDEVENLMRHYRRTQQNARVEVVANSGGLNLLLADISPFADRIHRMQEEYANLTFVACQNTIDRFQQELGISARLLPGVVVIDSGVAQIMRRQHQGWAYIQV